MIDPADAPGARAGSLVVISTPIGNLGDLTDRARSLLGSVDLLCCEDTRTTGKLLGLIGVPAPRLCSLHEHNEHLRIPEVLDLLAAGATVGLVADAGTPLLSDPGARLVAAAADAGATVNAAPGASAALAALVCSGLGGGPFRFEGFLPRKGRERSDRLVAVATSGEPSILYEAPTRIAATLDDLARSCGSERPVAVARELTKLHEETWRGNLGSAAGSPPVRAGRGEYVVVVGGAPPADDGVVDDLSGVVAALAAAGLRRRDAVAAIEILLGVTHRRAYDAALGEAGFAHDR